MASEIKANTYNDFNSNPVIVTDGSGNVTIGSSGKTITTAGSGLATTPAFFVQKNAVQSCANNTSTQVTYQTEIVDTDSAFASNTFTVPSGKNGVYFLFAQVRFDTSTDFSYIANEVKVNDVAVFSGWNRNIDYSTVYVSGFANLSVGDTVKHLVQQQSGGTINIGGIDRGAVTYLGGHKLIT